MKFLFFLLWPLFAAALTLEEKVGQLFVTPISNALPYEAKRRALEAIEKYHVGSVILTASSPESQIDLVQELQFCKKLPFLTLQDAEWGLSMRLTPALRFPHNLTLGAIQDENLLYLYGKEVGRELKLVGVHIGLLPVVDVNTNPQNPIIGDRSFGDDPIAVGRKGTLVMQGLLSSGVWPCGKHFPGHGDTSQDSHLVLPCIDHPKERLESIEFLPFKALIDARIPALMSAHITVPSLDPSPNLPATMSRKIIHDLLHQDFHFDGLVITDALNMEGMLQSASPQEGALQAVMAGCDLLLYGHHLKDHVDQIYADYLPKAYTAILEAVKEGKITEEELDLHVMRVLKAKSLLASKVPQMITTDQLFTQEAKMLKRTLYRRALTQLGEPFLASPNITCIQIGGEASKQLQAIFSQFFLLSKNASDEEVASLIQKTSSSVIVVFLGMTKAGDYGIPLYTKQLYETLSVKGTVLFGTPYALPVLPKTSILIAYEDDPDAIEAVCDALTGILTPTGKLPIQM